MTYLIAIICVAGIAVGQILLSAASCPRTESFYDLSTLASLVSAFALFEVTTLA
jgi:hypothetical protein